MHECRNWMTSHLEELAQDSNFEVHRFDKNNQRTLGRVSTEEMKAEVDSKARMQKNLDEIKNLSRQERKAWSLKKKEQGTILYTAKKFSEAVGVYHDGLIGLVLSDNEAHNIDMRREVQLPLLYNIAACFIEMNIWLRVIELSEVALRIDSVALKPLFRIGLSLFNLGRTTEAEPLLEDVVNRCTSILEGKKIHTAIVDEPHKTLTNFKERASGILIQIGKMKKKESAFAKNMFKKAGNLYEERSPVFDQINQKDANEVEGISQNDLVNKSCQAEYEKTITHELEKEPSDNDFVFVSYRDNEPKSFFKSFMDKCCAILKGPCPKRKTA